MTVEEIKNFIESADTADIEEIAGWCDSILDCRKEEEG